MTPKIFKYKDGIDASLIKLEDDGTFKYDNHKPLFEVKRLECSSLTPESGLILQNPDQLRQLELFNNEEWELFPLFKTRGPSFTKRTTVFDANNKQLKNITSINDNFTCSVLLEPISLSYFGNISYLNVILHQVKILNERELPLGCVLCESLDSYKQICKSE